VALVAGAASRRAGVELASELAEVVPSTPEDLDARSISAAALTSIGRVDPSIAVYEEILRPPPAPGHGAQAAATCTRQG